MKNCFDRTPHTMKDWLLLAAGTAAVFAAADWLPGVLRGAGAFLGLLAPFGWGLLLAYVLDIPTRFFAQKLFGGRQRGGHHFQHHHAGPGILQGTGLLHQFIGSLVATALYAVAAQGMHGLRGEAQVGAHRNAALDQKTHDFGGPAAAPQA
jgi:hypothetical protein